MKYLIIILLVVGALIAYPSKYIFKLAKKKEPTDNEAVKIKLIGLMFVILAAILALIFLR